MEFFGSADFQQDQAYGTRVVKTAIGNIVIPDVIRLTSNSRIVDYYLAFCKDTNVVKHIKKSTHKSDC